MPKYAQKFHLRSALHSHWQAASGRAERQFQLQGFALLLGFLLPTLAYVCFH